MIIYRLNQLPPEYALNDIVETYEVYQVTNSLGNLETVRKI